MFEIDSIRDGVSANRMRVLGGPNGLLEGLHSNIKTGINQISSELDARREQFGDNAPFVKVPNTLWQMIVDCFEDLML